MIYLVCETYAEYLSSKQKCHEESRKRLHNKWLFTRGGIYTSYALQYCNANKVTTIEIRM